MVQQPDIDRDGGLSRLLLKPLLLVWSVVFLWLIATRVYNPDEFEALHQGWLLFIGKVQYVDFNSNHPPILFQLLRLLHYISDDPTVLLHLARAICVVAGVASLVFVYRIGRSVFDETSARWAVIAFAINATLWEWMVDVRTDTLLVPLWLAAISLVVDPRRPNLLRAAIVGLLMGTAFWVNQKAVLHSVPLGLFMILGGPNNQWKFKHWAWAVLVSLIPAVVVLWHAAGVGSLASLIENNFTGGSEMVHADPYGDFRTLTMRKIMRYDFGMVVLVLISYVRMGSQILTRPREQQFVFFGSLWMMLTFFWTPGPFGYYMLSIFPLALVIVGRFLSNLPWRLLLTEHRVPVVACMVIYCLFPLSWLAWFVQPTNQYQREVISVGAMLTDSESKVLDLSGCLINRHDSYRFHTRQTMAEQKRFTEVMPALIPEVKKNGCDFFLRYDRTDPKRRSSEIWPPETWDTIPHQFVQIWGPIHVPGYDSLEPVKESEIEIDLWFDGTYETKTKDLLIDGQPFIGELKLNAGRHAVTLADPGQRVQILNASYRKRGTLPPDSGEYYKFLDAYWAFRLR